MAKLDSSTRDSWALLLLPQDVKGPWRELLSLVPGYDPFATAADSRFDAEAAKLALDFFPECLHHVEGDLAGKPFVLERWQQAIVANLFGWKRKDDKGRTVRRYREALLYVPRKNGKTPWAAGVALFVFFCDEEAGQQDYIAAADREQAGKLFRQARGMVEAEPELYARCRIYGGNAAAGQAKSIVKDDNSFLQVISADASAQHGGTTHLGIIDELHTQPTRELVDVLTTSTASLNRKQPLTIHITTADFNRPSICNEKHDYACKVRDGIIADPSFLPVIYEALPTEPWDDPKTWAKANPNLGISVSREYLERECMKAKETPAYENTFKRLHLNMKTEQDVRAIAMEKWDACSQADDPAVWRREAIARLLGRECWGGLDLGSTADLTALGLLFPEENGRLTLLPWFWAPRLGAAKRERTDRVPYLTWARQGFITLTEGDVTDYDKVRADVNELAGQFSLRELAVDRLFQGAQLCTQLQGDGLQVVAFGQGFYSMAAPTKRMLEVILEGSLDHGNNPVLRWQAANAATEEDAAGNLKFSKRKSTEKIDGIVGATMALGRAMMEVVDAGPEVILW